jgi:hypothetical protein
MRWCRHVRRICTARHDGRDQCLFDRDGRMLDVCTARLDLALMLRCSDANTISREAFNQETESRSLVALPWASQGS